MLQRSQYDSIPDHGSEHELFEVRVNDLQPTQMCVGLSEVWSRQQDFQSESAKDSADGRLSRPGRPQARSVVSLPSDAGSVVWHEGYDEKSDDDGQGAG